MIRFRSKQKKQRPTSDRSFTKYATGGSEFQYISGIYFGENESDRNVVMAVVTDDSEGGFFPGQVGETNLHDWRNLFECEIYSPNFDRLDVGRVYPCVYDRLNSDGVPIYRVVFAEADRFARITSIANIAGRSAFGWKEISYRIVDGSLTSVDLERSGSLPSNPAWQAYSEQADVGDVVLIRPIPGDPPPGIFSNMSALAVDGVSGEKHAIIFDGFTANTRGSYTVRYLDSETDSIPIDSNAASVLEYLRSAGIPIRSVVDLDDGFEIEFDDYAQHPAIVVNSSTVIRHQHWIAFAPIYVPAPTEPPPPEAVAIAVSSSFRIAVSGFIPQFAESGSVEVSGSISASMTTGSTVASNEQVIYETNVVNEGGWIKQYVREARTTFDVATETFVTTRTEWTFSHVICCCSCNPNDPTHSVSLGGEIAVNGRLDGYNIDGFFIEDTLGFTFGFAEEIVLYGPGSNYFTGGIVVDGGIAIDVGFEAPVSMDGKVAIVGTISGFRDDVVKREGFGGEIAVSASFSEGLLNVVGIDISGNAAVDGSLSSTEEVSHAIAMSGDVAVDGLLLAASESVDYAALSGLVAVDGSVAVETASDEIESISGEIAVVGEFAAKIDTTESVSQSGLIAVDGAVSALPETSSSEGFSGSVAVEGSATAVQSNETSASASFSGLIEIDGSLSGTQTTESSSYAAMLGEIAVEGSLAAAQANEAFSYVAFAGEIAVDGSLAGSQANESSNSEGFAGLVEIIGSITGVQSNSTSSQATMSGEIAIEGSLLGVRENAGTSVESAMSGELAIEGSLTGVRENAGTSTEAAMNGELAIEGSLTGSLASGGTSNSFSLAGELAVDGSLTGSLTSGGGGSSNSFAFAGELAAEGSLSGSLYAPASWPVSTDTGTTTAVPLELVEGSDGRIWFYRNGENRISALNTSTGVITDYTRTGGSETIGGICAGPDGNIWYTVYNVAKVGKLTTSGTFTEYTVPVAGEQICSDGTDLYYCSYSAGSITKVGTGGSSTQYFTTGSLLLTGICASGGNIWSCAYVGDKIVKMTTAGSFTYYTVSSGGNPWLCSPDGTGIVFSAWGSGAKVWFCTSGGTITSQTVTGSDIQLPVIAGDGNFYWGRRLDGAIGKLSGSTYSTFASGLSVVRYVLPISPYLYYQTNNTIGRLLL